MRFSNSTSTLFPQHALPGLGTGCPGWEEVTAASLSGGRGCRDDQSVVAAVPLGEGLSVHMLPFLSDENGLLYTTELN